MLKHMPGDDADELACRDHAGRAKGDALGQDLDILSTLLHQVADQIFSRLALCQTAFACFDSGFDIQHEKERNSVLHSQQCQQGLWIPLVERGDIFLEKRFEALRHARQPTIRQTNDLSGHQHRHFEAQLAQIELLLALYAGHQPIREFFHELAIVCAHGFGCEEACCLPALLLVALAILIQNGWGHIHAHAAYLLRVKTCLSCIAAAQYRPRLLKAPHMPYTIPIALNSWTDRLDSSRRLLL